MDRTPVGLGTTCELHRKGPYSSFCQTTVVTNKPLCYSLISRTCLYTYPYITVLLKKDTVSTMQRAFGVVPTTLYGISNVHLII